MSKQEQLHKIKQQILDDKVCPELAKQATQLVFGDGNSDADIVFIGEAPGKNEDLQGIPFVGAAGKFLNEMLEMIGLKREDIYITNIVKYRPPNNRDPLPKEKSVFLPYLQQQIDIIKPKLIVTLGRHSMDSLLPNVASCASCRAGGSPERCSGRVEGEYRKEDVAEATFFAERNQPASNARSGGASSLQAGRACDVPLRISEVHGQPKRMKGQVYLPLFHPAAALYNGGMRQILIDDFLSIPVILEKITEATAK